MHLLYYLELLFHTLYTFGVQTPECTSVYFCCKKASQSEDRDVGGTVPSPHCHDKHVHRLENTKQCNAVLAGNTFEWIHSAELVVGSNKSDNNNAGVAQLGMASSACQQLPIYIYEIYMKLDLSITMRVLLLKHCNACPSSSDTHGAPLPMKSIGRQTLFHGPRVTGYLLSGASTLVHHHRCITSGALLLVHHLWYIPSGASRDSGHHHLNIARGTTDPEIDSMTCICCKFSHQMTQLALVVNLATRWYHLHKLQI